MHVSGGSYGITVTGYTTQGIAVVVGPIRKTNHRTRRQEIAQGCLSCTTMQIYWGTFQPSKSMKLAYDVLTWSTVPKAKKDKEEPESIV